MMTFMSLQTDKESLARQREHAEVTTTTAPDVTSMSDERLTVERELLRHDWQEMVSHAGNSMADIELLVSIDRSLTAIAVEMRSRSMARHPSSAMFKPRQSANPSLQN